MRIATWNVNSLKARLEKVTWWLGRTRPDVLLMQETKLADGDVPVEAFEAAGYEVAHHGEGRWNGVAIASRIGIADVVTNFGAPLRPAATADVGDDEPLAEARMISAVCGGVRVVSLYAPNGRSVDSPFYHAKLTWYDALARWLPERAQRAAPGEAALFVDAKLCDAILNDADLHGSDLSGAALEDATLNGANLSWTVLSGAGAAFAPFDDANLSNAIWRDGAANGASFDGADLHRIDLRNTDLRSTSFVETDLRYAQLGGVDLTNADLTGADWRGAAGLASATFSNTTCPDGTNSDTNTDGTCAGH